MALWVSLLYFSLLRNNNLLPIHLSQKMCQIRREIVKLMDYDGTLSSFYRFSLHNPFCEPTPLVTTVNDLIDTTSKWYFQFLASKSSGIRNPIESCSTTHKEHADSDLWKFDAAPSESKLSTKTGVEIGHWLALGLSSYTNRFASWQATLSCFLPRRLS